MNQLTVSFKPVLFSFFLVATFGCEKAFFPLTEYASLPKMTASGENTFGCLVDAKASISKPSLFNPGKLQISYTHDPIGGNFKFIMDCKTSEGAYFYFSIPEELMEGKTYVLTNTFDAQGDPLDPPIFYKNAGYYLKSPLKGELKVSFYNASQKIVCGTFWFDAQTIDLGSLVHVTDGRFDLKIDTP
jgi:hypothetical protein